MDRQRNRSIVRKEMVSRKDWFTSRNALYAMCMVFLFYPLLYRHVEMVLSWDVFGYYLYLPLTVIRNDLMLNEPDWLFDMVEQYQNSGTMYQAYALDDGQWVLKYTMGLAILLLPFFLGGHLFALILGSPADGLSEPYQIAIMLGSLCYTLLGFWYLRKLLLLYLNDRLTAFLLILIPLGTNFLVMNAELTATTHVILFPLHAMLLYYTIKWHKSPSRKHAAFTGLLIGLIVVSRPADLFVVFIPLFWPMKGMSLLEKWKFMLKRHRLSIGLLGGIAFFIVFPQLLYWKVTTGHWVYFSYNNPGEGFEFASPFLKEYLFSFRKGWFIYTPIMFLAVLSLMLVFARNRRLFWPLGLFILANIYIASSWSTWWYGFSFSQRAMVQSYPELTLALGLGLAGIKNLPILFRSTAVVLFLLLVLHLFQTWQYKQRILLGDRMTQAYYIAVFGRTSVPKDAERLLLVNRDDELTRGFVWKDDYTAHKFERYVFPEHGADACVLDSSRVFSPAIRAKYNVLTTCDHAWLEIRFSLEGMDGTNMEGLLLVASFEHGEHLYKYMTYPTDTMHLEKQEDGFVSSVFYLTPELRDKDKDSFVTYLWYQQPKGAIRIRRFELIVHERKF